MRKSVCMRERRERSVCVSVCLCMCVCVYRYSSKRWWSPYIAQYHYVIDGIPRSVV